MARARRRPPQRPIQAIRQQLLSDLKILQIPLTEAALDTLLAQGEQHGWSYLEFVYHLVSAQAGERRARRLLRRLHEARLPDLCELSAFDWSFNSAAINRAQIEELASCDFVRRRSNLILVGQSGVGKSFLVKALARLACMQDLRVRYSTSAKLLRQLTAALADRTLERQIRYYTGFDLLAIDEFGFDRLERQEIPEAASLLYQVIDARHQKRSTALVTNLDFELWGEYLGDKPLAMALLDRLVDGATILKIKGKSYRAHRSRPSQADDQATENDE